MIVDAAPVQILVSGLSNFLPILTDAVAKKLECLIVSDLLKLIWDQ